MVSKNVYEGMFLLDSSKLHSNWDAAAEIVHRILERYDCEILVSRQWEERRLAYPIKKQRKGMYYLTYFRTEPANIAKIEHDCRLTPEILRQLILKIHPKLVEPLIAQAQAYTGVTEEGAEGAGSVGSGGEGAVGQPEQSEAEPATAEETGGA